MDKKTLIISEKQIKRLSLEKIYELSKFYSINFDLAGANAFRVKLKQNGARI